MPARYTRRAVPEWVKVRIHIPIYKVDPQLKHQTNLLKSQSPNAFFDADAAYGSDTDSVDSDTSSTISALSIRSSISTRSSSSTITTLSSLPDDPLTEPSLPINRRFRPELIYPQAHFTPRDIEVPRGRWVYLACPHSRVKCSNCGVHVAHTDAIVIAMDGASRTATRRGDGNEAANADADAVSSLGVFCGFGNPYNRAQTIDDLSLHTSQTAELKACVRALCQAGLIGEDHALPTAHNPHGRDVRFVVIKSNSEHVVRGVTELLPRWKANGWRNSRGVEVANAEEFRVIDRLVHSLRGDGIEVRFWLVPKAMNRQAQGMARNTLRVEG
ncbi:hypothetical protein BJY01DRAFT_247743 [Aspergillus pseudoustus]|uniref:RNase H type-1 domain-containing protein n=1 Tax=Aspergillus pseudoustus TaxID=1810923 RepID=A0ABR4JZS0_9EURO